MEEELIDAVPCSSLAVDAILRIGTVTKIYLLFHNINSIKVSPNAYLLEYISHSIFRQVQFGDCVQVHS